MFAWESFNYLLFVEGCEGSIVDKQADIVKRHCQNAAALPLFCICVLVTSKMSHGVNKSCITQHVLAQGGYASEVV